MYYLPQAFYGGVAGFAADTPFVSTPRRWCESVYSGRHFVQSFPEWGQHTHRRQSRPRNIHGTDVPSLTRNRRIPMRIRGPSVFNTSCSGLYGSMLPTSDRVPTTSTPVKSDRRRAQHQREYDGTDCRRRDKIHRCSRRRCQIRSRVCCRALSLNGATVPRSQLLKPYPQFNRVTIVGESVGKIWYDALQIAVEKRYTRGLVLCRPTPGQRS